MEKIEILKIESLSREPLVIDGYLFKGTNKDAPSVAIIGAMEGQSIMPLYSASKLINFLNNGIDTKEIQGDILVIPSINHYALNISKRFWPLDNTDINMMFPGFDQGETTQRIAKKVFDIVSSYDNAIILERRPDPADCLPYIKLYKSGYENLNDSLKFGFRFVHHRNIKSIDTVSLQYNLQLWETNAYSIMCPTDTKVNKSVGDEIVQGMIRYLNNLNIINYHIFNGFKSNVITRESIEVIQSPNSGIFVSSINAGDYITKGDKLGEVIDSLLGEVVYEFKSPCNGMVTCTYNGSLIYENAVAYRIARVR